MHANVFLLQQMTDRTVIPRQALRQGPASVQAGSWDAPASWPSPGGPVLPHTDPFTFPGALAGPPPLFMLPPSQLPQGPGERRLPRNLHTRGRYPALCPAPACSAQRPRHACAHCLLFIFFTASLCSAALSHFTHRTSKFPDKNYSGAPRWLSPVSARLRLKS